VALVGVALKNEQGHEVSAALVRRCTRGRDWFRTVYFDDFRNVLAPNPNCIFTVDERT